MNTSTKTLPLLLLVLSSATPAAWALCNSALPSQANSRYSASNGVVSDSKTGLMWQQCSLGQTYDSGSCSGTATRLTWTVATSQASAASDFGFSDWRLPDRKELESLVDLACASPAINAEIFPATAIVRYWSSSPYLSGDSLVWSVNFYDGQVFAQAGTDTAAVRLVRSIP